MDKIYAIIPARGGSKGVPKKNIKTLAGYPLIAYSIAVAHMCPNIHRIVVSTDSKEIAAISSLYGADVPFLRPEELASDTSPDRDFVMHALNWFKEKENVIPDYLVHLRPTTPLRAPLLVEEAIDRLINNPEATSLRSAHEAPESPFKWFMCDDKGYFYGFSQGTQCPGYLNLPRQFFPKVYVPDGYVDILKTKHVIDSDDIHGDRIMSYISPMCVEVDSIDEYEFLEFQISRHKSPLLDFLKSNYPQAG